MLSNFELMMISLIGLLSASFGFLFDRKWIASVGSLIIFSVLFVYVSSFTRYLDNLGTDSLFELSSFDLTEAIGLVKTLGQVIEPNPHPRKSLLLKLFLAAVSFQLIFSLFSTTRRFQYSTCALLVFFPLVFLPINVINIAKKDSIDMGVLESNFNPTVNYSVEKSRDDSNLKVITFIGESTSTMNLGMYGYFRDTTPELDKLIIESSNLLKFNNVFSTHVHTVPSLLEALSLQVNESEQRLLPITSRSRIPLVDILKKADLKTHLISNQTRYGSWNAAGPILFENADSSTYSTNNRYLGNLDWNLDRPEEFAFFRDNLSKLLTDEQNSSIFLHSYIGHYFYKSRLPNGFEMPVDNMLNEMMPKYIFGPRHGNQLTLDLVEISDSSYKYLDYVLSQLVKLIELEKQPIILVYFADHGDAVYAGLGHDSSRFQHEMSRVPFFVFFNSAARAKYSDLYDTFSKRAASSSVSSLTRLSETLLKLHGITVTGLQKHGSIHASDGIANPPILVREIATGIKYLNPFWNTDTSTETVAEEVTDNASSIFKLATNPTFQNNIICYHRANSIAKALRGLLVTQCLEVDIVVSGKGQIFVDHDKAEGPLLETFFKIADDANDQLWLDAKNIDQPEMCWVLSKYLSEQVEYPERVMIEFPSETDFKDHDIAKCVDQMRKTGATTSYYVPTSLGLECMKMVSLSTHTDLTNIQPCRNLLEKVINVVETNLVSEINFDHRLHEIFELVPLFNDYSWNIWGVNAEDIGAVDHVKYNRIIVNTDMDPNSR